MSTRRQWHLATLAAVAALVAAGCGGGGSEQTLNVGKVISFGDSLSDLGAYTPATQIPLGQAAGVPPFFGGKFTTNTHTGYSAASNSSTANIWVEVLAARLGVPITPHEVGFGPQSVKCPAIATSPALASSCTGYGQGGSRVSNPAGIGNPNGTGLVGANPVPMTRPMTTQVANHLARFSAFDGNDIVFVWGGNNDAFVQFGAVAQGLPPATAIANMQTAATELATLVKNEILAKGASRVAVLNLLDASSTPGFSGLSAAQKGLLSQLSAEFNTALAAGLSGSAAQIIDVRSFASDAIGNPGKYGLTNSTAAACDPVKIAAITANRITDGSSLFCNAAPASSFPTPLPNLNGLKAGASASTWLFADGVHPTTGGHRVLSDFLFERMKGFGWVPNNL